MATTCKIEKTEKKKRKDDRTTEMVTPIISLDARMATGQAANGARNVRGLLCIARQSLIDEAGRSPTNKEVGRKIIMRSKGANRRMVKGIERVNGSVHIHARTPRLSSQTSTTCIKGGGVIARVQENYEQSMLLTL
jgi:hypothetical protein